MASEKASKVPCHECGKEYQLLGNHWGHGCPPPEPTEKQHQMFIGAMMGDGTMTGQNGSRQFRLSNTNKDFLQWFDNKMGVLTTGIKKDRSPKELAEAQERSKGGSYNAENYKQTYYVSSRSVDYFNQFDEWYSEGRIKFPENLELTPTISKLWYACDGYVRENDQGKKCASIASTNEIKYHQRAEWLVSLFKEKGFTAWKSGNTIDLSKHSTQKFLNWMGEPVPGFKSKWLK